MKRILIVVGTRPNYIKITQFKKIASKDFSGAFNIKIVHTGQHFDKAMADDFFNQLDIYPDYKLDIPKGTATNQIGEILIRLEAVVTSFKPDWIIVPGDVNSTLAAAVTANKMDVPLIHLESGLRSFDRSMPEEINRILVDEISDLCFVTEQSGVDNLIREGKPREKIHLVGNTMIDTLVAFQNEIQNQSVLEKLDINLQDYALVTMHRPATVDNEAGLMKLKDLLVALSNIMHIVFPMHPRTLKTIKAYNLESDFKSIENLTITGPIDYFSFQKLIAYCTLVITDSGGIQEETTFKQKPCITLRPNTERPVTIDLGTNMLLDFNMTSVLEQVSRIMKGNYKTGNIPELWDGYTTYRILDYLYKIN